MAVSDSGLGVRATTGGATHWRVEIFLTGIFYVYLYQR
ncbi:hypothetical protein F01_460229 [Burkholderia cenocepacia]|nr:hypothetical protein F01_460229 [Burkholderia cenocepacia]